MNASGFLFTRKDKNILRVKRKCISLAYYLTINTIEMITFTREVITPEVAKSLMENHPLNRRPKQRIIDLYAAEIAAGKWKTETAEPIKIGTDGSLLDGQHRLLAIIKSKIPLTLYVARNIPLESFDVLDTGTVRNASDVFKIKGIPHENILPSIIGMYNVLKIEGRSPLSILKNQRGTNAMLLKQYQQDTSYWQEIAKASLRWYNDFSKVIPPSFVGGFYAFFLEKSGNDAERFMSQLCTGSNIENEAIVLLRNKLVSDKINSRKMPMDLKMALILKSWNFFIDKKGVTMLKWDSVREPFPIAKGIE